MKTRITTSKLIAIGAIGIILGLAGLACFFIQSPASTSSKPAAPTETTAKAAYGKLPLSFELNQGQTDSQVKFLARGSGYTLFLTGAEAVLTLRPGDRETGRPGDRGTRGQGDKKTRGQGDKTNSQSATRDPQSSVLRMKLVGVNTSPQPVGLDELPGKSNYFIGADPKQWRTNVPTYAKAKFAAVYPGVDVVYYGTQGQQLEYDFVIAPGADPKAIKLSFEGADKIEVDKQGDLALSLDGKELRLRKPVVYQEIDGVKQEIAGGYALMREREIGFEIAAYDATRPLVIDPILVYSTFLGGAGQERGVEIAVNAHGNAFVTGFTTSIAFPTNAFPTEPNGAKFGPGGGLDAFVTKFNAAGNLLIYSTYLGGSNDENYYPELNEPGTTYGGIALDSSDNAYVTGLTRSPNFPVTPNVYQSTLKGLSDAFITKLNAAGNALVYSTFLGCNGVNKADGGQGIAVDALGQAYVTGFDYSGGLPSMIFPHSAGVDGYVAKLNTTGSALLYSTYFSGNADNLGWAIAVDGDQNAYVTGETVSTNFPMLGAFDPICGTDNTCNPVYDPELEKIVPQSDIFVIKMDTKIANIASHKYSTYLGGSKEERYNCNASIAVDAEGEFIYLTGLTASVNPVDFPIKNALQPLPNCTSSGCSAEAFITKLDISQPLKSGFGQIVYSTYLGGPGTEIGTGIAADINGNAYVAGATGGTFPSTSGMSICTDPGVFVAKVGANGAKIYATCISGLGQDTGLDLAIDPAGCVYVTGWTESNNYPTVNPFQPFFAGGTGLEPSDGFVTKICSGLDHFKCYDVQAQEHFQPFNVILRDQFESQEVTVLRPTTLCNPVIKCVPTGNPAKPFDCNQRLNPDDHLVCYETSDERGTPQFEQREVIVSNQFGKEQPLTVLRRKNLLCVPSLKAHR